MPSGLWGLSAAHDPLPAYRLGMGARVPSIGGLSAFWRPRVTPLVAARAGRGWVIDLLPDEHAAAIDGAALAPARLVRVELVDGAAGARRAMGHAGKTLKGRLARAILEAGCRDPSGLERLEVPGLSLEASLRERRGGPVTMVFSTAPP